MPSGEEGRKTDVSSVKEQKLQEMPSHQNNVHAEP